MPVKSGLQRAVSAACLFGSLSISFIAILWVIVSKDRIDLVEGLLVLTSALVALALPRFGARAFHRFDTLLGRVSRKPLRSVLLVGASAVVVAALVVQLSAGLWALWPVAVATLVAVALVQRR